MREDRKEVRFTQGEIRTEEPQPPPNYVRDSPGGFDYDVLLAPGQTVWSCHGPKHVPVVDDDRLTVT